MSDMSELIEAVKQSPRSAALVRALLREAADAVDPTPAIAFVTTLSPAGFDAALRGQAALFLLDHDEPQSALAWTEGEPGLLIPRARALLELGDVEQAKTVYQEALKLAPDQRDAVLDAALTARQAQGHGDGVVVDMRGRRLKTDTDDTPNHGPRDRVTFADVGGLSEVKAQIRRKIITPFEKPGLFERFRKRAGGGVLLYGPPGCGKTLMARATANEVGAHFIPVEIPSVLDMYIGESEKKLAQIFTEARNRKPAVIFFDEIEALAARRRFTEHDHRASMVSAFLNEMDGFSSANDRILVLAATNVPWAVDPAFRRPGRFDRVVFIPPPDREARKVILALELKDRPTGTDIDLDTIANATGGFSGADLTSVVETACDIAIEESLSSDRVSSVTQRHLKDALKEVKPSTLEWLSQARNYARYANEGGLYDDVLSFLDQHTRS